MASLLGRARSCAAVVVLIGIPVVTSLAEPGGTQTGWTELEEGLDLGRFQVSEPSEQGDNIVTILRIDPGRFELELFNASADPEGLTRTAKDWCAARGAIAAINTSMYQTDHRTSVSLMKTRDHINNARLSKDKAILALHPVSDSIPPVRIIDRQCDDLDRLRDSYATLVQSIRMVSCERKNVWAQQPRKWSTAAIGIDRGGRLLFIHSRSPYTVHDFINYLLEFPIDLERAMYVEGGPEAQLYFRAGDLEEEHVGSFETGFLENDSNVYAWPIPNVFAVMRREESRVPQR